MQADAVRVGHHLPDIILAVAAGGEVELVAFVDQLRDARLADRIEAVPDQPHLQAREVVADVVGVARETGAGGVGLILRAAKFVFLG